MRNKKKIRLYLAEAVHNLVMYIILLGIPDKPAITLNSGEAGIGPVLDAFVVDKPL